MNVRPASFRDLGRIEQLYTEALRGDDAAESQLHTDHPVPQSSPLVRLWFAVSKTLTSLMPLTDTGDSLYVAEHARSGVVGFVQAQPAPGKMRAWQIVNLCTDSSAMGQLAAQHLLEGLARYGQEANVNRFYVRLPLNHPLLSAFMGQGFTQYATEQILFAEHTPASTEGGSAAGELRPAHRDDVGSINLLYLRVTPATVAAIEAPNRKSWEATFAGGALARMGKDSVIHLVAENPGIYAWAAMTPASSARPTGLLLMCEAHQAAEREAFVDAVLQQLPPGPVSSVLRHYDSELIRALQQRGFAIYGTQVLLIRDMAQRVKVPARAQRQKASLVPAGVARSVPSAVRLHVLPSVSPRRSSQSQSR